MENDSNQSTAAAEPDPVAVAMRKVLKARETYIPECVKLTGKLLQLRLQDALEAEVKLNLPQSPNFDRGNKKADTLENVQDEFISNAIPSDCVSAFSEQVEKLMLNEKEVQFVLKQLESEKQSNIVMHLNHQV